MIKVRSKTLFIPAEEQSIGAVGEADSTVREFHIDRVSGDGVDLANLLFKLNIRYAGVREIDRSDLEKVVTDNAIILRWLISSVTLRNAGTAFLQLDAFDETGSCRWKSYPGAVYIEKSLGNAEIPSNTLSELEQLEKKFAKVGEGESSRVEAEKKRVIAEEKREEAEGKRNTSLASIVAEEEKIKALSTETKGYRDSVKTDKDAITADKQAITAIKNEAVSARETAQQHASAAEASKNNTITEGVKIKEAVINLKNEANTAKTDAVNAKNEAVSAKNGANTIKGEVLALKNEANTIKGEVQALKNETESRIQSAESNIQNQVMNATSYAGMAERSSQQAEGYKMEAGVSAEKAKESETKTLEALAKAQEGGKVAGITSDEMHSYVDNAVANIHSGLTEEEVQAKIDSNKITNNPTLTPESVALNLGHPDGYPIAFGIDQLATGRSLAIFLNGIKKRNKEINSKPYRNIADLYQIYPDNTVNVLKEINKRIREDSYGDIRLGDYINVKLNGLDKPMKFVAVGIDFYKGIKSYPDSENPQKQVVEKVPLKHIDFVCIDTDLTLDLPDEEITSFTGTARETRCRVSLLVCKSLLKRLRKDNLDFFNELAYKPCLDLQDGFNSWQQPYTFKTHLPLWVPTPEEVTGMYVAHPAGSLTIESNKMALQYPYFAEHPEVFDGGYYKGFKPKAFSYSCDSKVAIYVTNGYYWEIPITEVFTKKGDIQVYIPLGFRLDGKQSNGSIIPPA